MENVLLEVSPPAALIILNRPEVRNALSPELLSDFREALAECRENHEIAGLIITGQGKAFSAGADLQALERQAREGAEQSRQDSLNLMQFFQEIHFFQKPVIAAVNGPALGGGCGLATVCDMVLASKEAIFGYPEVKIGFVPALVSVFILRICSEKKARELLLTGRTFSAAEALELGLVNRVVEPSELLDRSGELVEEIAGNSPQAVAMTKNLLNGITGVPTEQALQFAAQINALMRTSDDFREGLAAFLEKRRPRWK